MNRKGFTLIEVIAAVAIMSLLVTVAGTNLIKKYNESRINAIIVQENQIVQSADLVVNDYCKSPINDHFHRQCDNFYKSYVDSNDDLVVEDGLYTKYICIKDLKDLKYYSEELRFSGEDCSGVVIYKIDERTDLQKDSFSVIKCGESYTTQRPDVQEYINIFDECFIKNDETPGGSGGTQEENTEYTLTINFTELTPNGMKVASSINKKYKHEDSVSIDVPAYSTAQNNYTPFKHGSSSNADNFELNDNRTKLTGTMPKGNAIVNIVYSIAKYQLVIKYKEFNDVVGNINFEPKIFEMFYGEEINIPYDTVDNFKIFSPTEMTYTMPQGNSEVTVVYQQEKFNLTYDTDGGSACTGKKVTFEQKFDTLCTTTKTGYTFNGWTLENGTVVNENTINRVYSDVKLYANWIPNKYVVLYNCNGGSPTSVSSSEHTYDETSSLLENNCTKTGYLFDGWIDSNNNTYTNKQDIINLRSESNDSITLNAVWKPLTYYVAFDRNGGTGNMSTMAVTYGQVVNLTKVNMARTGHSFDGWLGSNGLTYADQAEIFNLTDIPEKTITMSAIWTRCGEGTYLANNICTSCQNGYYSEGGTNSCTECPAGSYCANGLKPQACPSGQYSVMNSTSCSTCGAGTYNTGTGNTGCTDCEVGYSCTGGTDRNVCPAGYYSSGKAFSCTRCPAGYYCPGGTDKIICPAGKYSAAGSSSCSTCSVGYYSAAGSSSCSTCPAGTYSASGNGSCSTCPAGYYCPGGSDKIICPAGKYSAAGASSCSTCSAGYYSAAGASSCTGCAAGTYSAAGASTCTTCTKGYYCPGSSNRVACAAGKYNGNTGSTSASACVNCSAGYYSGAGASSCTGCAAGTYSGSGASSCTTCTAGYYCPGSSNRNQCPAGKYSSAGASSCSTCTAGTYSSAGSSSCTTCSAGTYNSGTGNSSCTTCEAGYYCTGGTNRTACPAGKYRTSTGGTSLSSCTTCEAGYYCTGGTNRTACPSGTNSPAGSTNSSSCVGALPGTYVAFDGSYWSWRSGSGCTNHIDCNANKCNTIGTATTELYVTSISGEMVHGWLYEGHISSIGAGGKCVRGSCASVCTSTPFETKVVGGKTYVKVQLADVYSVFRCAVNGTGC